MPRLAWQLVQTSTLLDVIRLVCHTQTLELISTTQHMVPRYIQNDEQQYAVELLCLFHVVTVGIAVNL